MQHTYITPLSPGEAPPGTGQRAEDGSEGQSREERVEGEVEQSLHPVIAKAFQRVNVVLKGKLINTSMKMKELLSTAPVFTRLHLQLPYSGLGSSVAPPADESCPLWS